MQTVLVVEDQTDVRKVVVRMLRRLGFLVLAAPDGEAALELAASHDGPIHLLLADVVMPGMDPADLSRRLGDERLGLRTIFMSGYPEDVLLRHLETDDATAVLQKPFQQEQLSRAIFDLIGAPERQIG